MHFNRPALKAALSKVSAKDRARDEIANLTRRYVPTILPTRRSLLQQKCAVHRNSRLDKRVILSVGEDLNWQLTPGFGWCNPGLGRGTDPSSPGHHRECYWREKNGAWGNHDRDRGGRTLHTAPLTSH